LVIVYGSFYCSSVSSTVALFFLLHLTAQRFLHLSVYRIENKFYRRMMLSIITVPLLMVRVVPEDEMTVSPVGGSLK
jgi:hypothetical protein